MKTLPEIQQFYTKSYRSIPEQWAEHQHNVDAADILLKQAQLQDIQTKMHTLSTNGEKKYSNEDFSKMRTEL